MTLQTRHPILGGKDGRDSRGQILLRGSMVAVALAGGCGADTPGGEAGWRSFSDDFDGSLSGWQTVHPERAEFMVADGELHVRPVRHTAWHGNQRAFQLYQTVEGDFAVTATVRVTNLAGGAPEPIWRLAGLQMRHPTSTSVDAYEGSFGSTAPWVTQGLVFHHKSTIEGVSVMDFEPHASGTGQIRLCRVGTTVRSMFRGTSDAPWVVADERELPRLNGPLAVGPVAYDYNGIADFEATFDDVSFAPLADMASCEVEEPESSGTTGEIPADASSAGEGTTHGGETESSGESEGESSGESDTESTDGGGDTDPLPDGSLPLDGSANVLQPGDRFRFIGNSFLALMNLHVQAIVSANQGITIATHPRNGSVASSANNYDGWFFGAGLWDMDPAIDWIANDGDIDTCVFISSALDGSDPRTTADDDEPLGGMRDFVEALTPICDHVVLYLTWGAYGASPTRNPNDYDAIIADYIADARTLEAEYPHVITVPIGLVFHDLMTQPPLAVPRADYLHRPNRDPHQNMLGAVIIAWTFYAVLADTSPVGAAYAYNNVMGPAFVVDERIGLGTPTDPFGGGTGETLPFDVSTQQLFQQRIHDLIVQWQTRTTVFDQLP